jgi:hypothetical protein
MHESSLLTRKYYIIILDGGADTCILGREWEILSIHSSRRANVVVLIMTRRLNGIFQLSVLLLP